MRSLLASGLMTVALLLPVACSRPKAPMGADANPGLQSGVKVLRQDHHLLFVLKVSRTTFDIENAGIVETPLPERKVQPEEEPWKLEVTNDSGRVLYVLPLPTPAVMRGEFKLDGGQIDALRVHTSDTVFPARVPLMEGASELRLYARAHSLPQTDSRTRGKAMNDWVELGQVRYSVPGS